MNQRRTISFLLPIVGLAFVASELQRLLEEPAPDALFFVIAIAFGLVFVARLAYLALEYFRSVR